MHLSTGVHHLVGNEAVEYFQVHPAEESNNSLTYQDTQFYYMSFMQRRKTLLHNFSSHHTKHLLSVCYEVSQNVGLFLQIPICINCAS